REQPVGRLEKVRVEIAVPVLDGGALAGRERCLTRIRDFPGRGVQQGDAHRELRRRRQGRRRDPTTRSRAPPRTPATSPSILGDSNPPLETTASSPRHTSCAAHSPPPSSPHGECPASEQTSGPGGHLYRAVRTPVGARSARSAPTQPETSHRRVGTPAAPRPAGGGPACRQRASSSLDSIIPL